MFPRFAVPRGLLQRLQQLNALWRHGAMQSSFRSLLFQQWWRTSTIPRALAIRSAIEGVCMLFDELSSVGPTRTVMGVVAECFGVAKLAQCNKQNT